MPLRGTYLWTLFCGLSGSAFQFDFSPASYGGLFYMFLHATVLEGESDAVEVSLTCVAQYKPLYMSHFSPRPLGTLCCVVGVFQAYILGWAHLQGFSFPSGCPCSTAAKWFLPMFSLAAWKFEASFLYQDILQDTFQVSRVVFLISDLPVGRHSSGLIKIRVLLLDVNLQVPPPVVAVLRISSLFFYIQPSVSQICFECPELIPSKIPSFHLAKKWHVWFLGFRQSNWENDLL